MAYILDGLVIIIFMLAIWMGYRRGFFKSIIQLVGCVARRADCVGAQYPGGVRGLRPVYLQIRTKPD